MQHTAPSDTIGGMSSHAVSPEQSGPAMSRRLRHDRPARPRGRLRAAPVVSVAVASLIPRALLLGVGKAANVWGGAEARASTPQQTLGVPGAGQEPLALTGPRGITVAAGLHEGRQRFAQ